MEKLSVDSGDKLNLWMLREVSARIIQRHFRLWYCWRLTLRHCRRRSRSSARRSSSSIPVSLPDSFQRIVNEQASFEDRMSFWRGAIELRRAHRELSTDLLLKAMIDSRADLSRSIVLLGTKSFIEKNSHDIPLKLRDLFSPRLDSNERVANGLVFDGAIVGMMRPNAVKQLKGSKQQDNRRSELLSLVDSVARRACFSKSHHGHRLHKKLQRVEDDAACSSASKPRIKQIVDRYSMLR